MHIEATKTFLKLYKKLDPKIKNQVKKVLILFQQDPSHPSLGHKKWLARKIFMKSAYQRPIESPTQNLEIQPSFVKLAHIIF